MEDKNPFLKAKTTEERNAVWKELQKTAVHMSKEEAEERREKAINLQKKSYE